MKGCGEAKVLRSRFAVVVNKVVVVIPTTLLLLLRVDLNSRCSWSTIDFDLHVSCSLQHQNVPMRLDQLTRKMTVVFQSIELQ